MQSYGNRRGLFFHGLFCMGLSKRKLVCNFSTDPALGTRDKAEHVPQKGSKLQDDGKQRHKPYLELSCLVE